MNFSLDALLLLADFGMPAQRSTFAADVDWLYGAIYYVCLFFFVGICIVTTWFMISYRRSVHPEPVQTPHHHLPLEVAWSVAPMLLVVGMFWYGFVGFMDMYRVPGDSYEISVTARKWSWSFMYPTGEQPADGKLHVPPNQNVSVRLHAEDVLHAFFVPVFRVKSTRSRPLPNGLVQRLPARGRRGHGRVRLFCAEYCGTNTRP